MQDVETTLRGPEAYGLASRAIAAMQEHAVWPTPLNFELWLHYVCDPQGPIAREIDRLLSSGELFTEAVTEELASTYLPKARLNEEIRDAGDQLSRELAAVAKAIESASKSSQAYGETLEGVSRELTPGEGKDPPLRKIVQTLTTATRKIQSENKSLETQLKDSTSEVARLRVHLEQVRRDATTDALTNLANRKAFDEELERACAEADALKKPVTLAVVDIDHFKGFNDTWGHQTGDQVIRYVASVLARVAEPPRFAARYGGEEFGMIFPGEFSAGVERLMDEVRAEVCSRSLKRRSTNDDLGAVTISIGLAERRPGESVVCFMERADEALYASKRGGRNRVTTAKILEADKAA
ncbi:MAG TPA: GGDEF domain-containing protein [Caulobacteraceae bacterium]